jgi:hypothetical protein
MPIIGQSEGRRLCDFIQIVDPSFSDDNYIQAFDRYCLWQGKELPRGPGSANLLRREGRRIERMCLREQRLVICLGAKVWSMVLDRTPPEWFSMQRKRESMFWLLPHPSPRSPMYGDPHNRWRAGKILLAVARESLARQAEAA